MNVLFKTATALAVMAISASSLYADTAATVVVVERSEPSGIVSRSTQVDTPAEHLTLTAPLVQAGQRFTHWTINGVRHDDVTGRAMNPVRFTVTGGQAYYYQVTAATLAYFPGSTVGALRESPMSEMVSAQVGAVRLWMPDYSAGAGQDAVLKINLDRAEGIRGQGLQVAVTYDAALLTPISQIDAGQHTVCRTAISEQLVFSDNALAANGELVISGLSGQAIGAGSLFDVVFRVNPAAVPFSCSTNTFSAATLSSVAGAGLTVDASDIAVFTVTSVYMRGDLNGDGVVNMDDHHHLLWLLQKNTREPTELELKAGDMNGDGELSQRDIPLLLRLIHGKDVNP